MEVTSVDNTNNTKVIDSVYSKSCSNSQSQNSGSSKSRHSNNSESSGYCGGNPSTLGSCNVAVLQPISKREDKEHKQKKSKPAIVAPAESEFPEGGKESPLQDGATPVSTFVGVSPQTESQETGNDRPYFDSKSSLATSPTYSQLNYYEKLQRYYKSQPCTTTMYEGEEENGNVLSSTKDEYLGYRAKSEILTDPTRKCMSPENGSEASGCESVGNSSSGSNSQSSSASQGDTSVMTDTASFKLSTLTQSSLTKHKEDMENLLLEHYRKIRSTMKSDKLKNVRPKSVIEKSSDSVCPSKTPTLKRTGSPIKNGRDGKVSKRDNISKVNNSTPVALNAAVSSASIVQPSVINAHSSSNHTARPYDSVDVPSAETAQPCTSAQTLLSQLPTMYPTIMQLVPLYYFATLRNGSVPTYIPQEHPGPSVQMQSVHQTPYNHYLTTGTAIYPSVMGIPTAMGIEYRPFIIPQSDLAVKNVCETTHTPVEEPGQVPCQNRLASQAASVKPESESITAESGCSKEVLSLGEHKCRSDENSPTAKIVKQDQSAKYHEDDSRCSSLYSSSWNESNGSSLNLDRKETREQSKSTGGKQTDVSNSDKEIKALRKQPSWLDGVKLTPELIYGYQMDSKTLQEVLEADKKVLKKFTQPLLVNDQLSQLYLDLELEGFGTKIMLDEGTVVSESASTDEAVEDSLEQKKEQHCSMEYGRLMMIHEENAQFPPS
ncbi:period circadian regulator [Neodiprion pinetum]|uniref:period circadian regulator n=1 Tax=Neodiprion pinetum TaxID=441929 RepID=UPI001EDE15ED|nr:period circadian protein-like [Neodiprion pinetum]